MVPGSQQQRQGNCHNNGSSTGSCNYHVHEMFRIVALPLPQCPPPLLLSCMSTSRIRVQDVACICRRRKTTTTRKWGPGSRPRADKAVWQSREDSGTRIHLSWQKERWLPYTRSDTTRLRVGAGKRYMNRKNESASFAKSNFFCVGHSSSNT